MRDEEESDDATRTLMKSKSVTIDVTFYAWVATYFYTYFAGEPNFTASGENIRNTPNLRFRLSSPQIDRERESDQIDASRVKIETLEVSRDVKNVMKVDWGTLSAVIFRECLTRNEPWKNIRI